MNLSEFLLARIAEDEATARDELMRLEKYPNPVGASYALTIMDVITPTRVLAECEAKRRIIAITEYGLYKVKASPTRSIADVLLMLLALPYADHPDYRKEWRP